MITTQPLAVVGKPVVKGDAVEVSCSIENGQIKKAQLNYTTDSGLRSKREWKTVPANIAANSFNGGVSFSQSYTITAPKPPADANTWFISVTDGRDAMVSTEVRIEP